MVMQEITRLNGTTDRKIIADIDTALKAVEVQLYNVVDSEVTVLRDASRHIIGAGGKRIRPRMLLASFIACGGHDIERVVPVASAVELVHTASVVHDDINDHGVLRRGRPSINAIWGRTFALLTGDYLFTKVYELMGPYKDLNIELAEATVALVEGETLQASAVKNNELSREVYHRIIALKTAALFKSAGIMGARLANAPEDHVRALGDFGYNLGLAFQIVDDILDLTADASQLGKTAGIDVEQGKGLASVEDADDKIIEIKQKVLAGDRIEEGYAQGRQLTKMAIQSLEMLPESAAKTGLLELADMVINRDH